MLAGHFQPPLAPPEEDSRPLSLDADQSSEEKSGGGGGGERKKDDDFLDEEVEAPLDIWRPRREPAGPKGGKEEDWISGFFDRDSFVEYMAGWAKTVITGRARLGGIPLGVIATENRTVTAVYPADPASIDSHETIVQQAGGVWYPDSAYKTAQAIRDFQGEGLPLIIFANWRGFSGGQRDMFNEILKYGSMIVEALVDYTQPVFVFIPPYAELRGGAWVVVDPTINSSVMEMYAAPEARGGVLEPSGTVEIKFRDRQRLAAAERFDPILKRLHEQLKEPGISQVDKSRIEKDIKKREKTMHNLYLQIAHEFADLHDTPGRMVAKKAINGVVPWSRARSFFYWRLRR
ncbi:ACAC [Symbiodinium sp. KB8]|nr:ACAC [Symbiodinium sp. KB8]